MLEKILNKTNYLIQRVHVLEERLKEKTVDEQIISEDVSNLMKRFPLKSMDDILEFEFFISNEDNYKHLVSFLFLWN